MGRDRAEGAFRRRQALLPATSGQQAAFLTIAEPRSAAERIRDA